MQGGIRKGGLKTRPYFVTFVSFVVRIVIYAPLRFFSSSINCGTILKRSPITPKSEY